MMTAPPDPDPMTMTSKTIGKRRVSWYTISAAAARPESPRCVRDPDPERCRIRAPRTPAIDPSRPRFRR